MFQTHHHNLSSFSLITISCGVRLQWLHLVGALLLFSLGVFIRFMGVELTDNISRVCLSDIGEQPPPANITVGVPDTEEGPALVCVTDNPNCCRPVDTSGSGAMGDWTLNRVFAVPGSKDAPESRIYRNRGTGLVRMNYRPNVEGADLAVIVTGEYCCTVPDMNNVSQIRCVEVTSELSIKHTIEKIYSLSPLFPYIIIDDTMCNSSDSTTTPVTTVGKSNQSILFFSHS